MAHNEQDTIVAALNSANKAAGDGIEVVAVDSGSTDQTAALAKDAGFQCLPARLGKGAAMQDLIRSTDEQWICFSDADIFEDSSQLLRDLIEYHQKNPCDLLLGDFGPNYNSFMSCTHGIYEPMVRVLFPEAYGKLGNKPLSGFRIINRELFLERELPVDFGVEAHLNIVAATKPNAKISSVRISNYRGRFLYKPWMGQQVADAIMNLAQDMGRLSKERRDEWQEWLNDIIAHVATFRGEAELEESFVKTLKLLAFRPLPPSN